MADVPSLWLVVRRSALPVVPMSDYLMGLKMSRPCPHCGEALVVYFKRDLSKPGAPLMGGVAHGPYDLTIEWVPVTGFEDAARIPPASEPTP